MTQSPNGTGRDPKTGWHVDKFTCFRVIWQATSRFDNETVDSTG